MSSDIFQETISKSNELINTIASELGWTRHQAYSCLSTILHAFRDRLPQDEAVNFSAQLPILIKGVYFEGWNPSATPIKWHKKDLLDIVRMELPFEPKDDIEKIIRVVLKAIFNQIDPGESEKIKKVLPKDIKELFD